MPQGLTIFDPSNNDLRQMASVKGKLEIVLNSFPGFDALRIRSEAESFPDPRITDQNLRTPDISETQPCGGEGDGAYLFASVLMASRIGPSCSWGIAPA